MWKGGGGTGGTDLMELDSDGQAMTTGNTAGQSSTTQWRSNYGGDYRDQPARPAMRTRDLICWAFQIARGMDYLARRKVLHGDLAARNYPIGMRY